MYAYVRVCVCVCVIKKRVLRISLNSSSVESERLILAIVQGGSVPENLITNSMKPEELNACLPSEVELIAFMNRFKKEILIEP